MYQQFCPYLSSYCFCYFQRIAESLNMSQRKVRNATEVLDLWIHQFYRLMLSLYVNQQCNHMQAISKVFSLDREAFPSLNGLPGETHHSVSEAQLWLILRILWVNYSSSVLFMTHFPFLSLFFWSTLQIIALRTTRGMEWMSGHWR
jgi:hypothetical protein